MVSEATAKRDNSSWGYNLRSTSQVRIADAFTSLGLLLVLASAFRPTVTAYMSIGGACDVFDKCILLALAVYPVVSRRAPGRITLIVSLYCFMVCLLSFVNGNLSQDVLYSYLRIALLVYYFEAQLARYPHRLLFAAFFVLVIICLWDALSVALYPNGLYQDVRYENEYYTASLSGWVLGLKNNHILWFLSLNIISSLLDWEKKRTLRPSLRTVACYAVSILITATMGSSTSTVVLSAMLALLFLEPIYVRARLIFNPRNVCVALFLVWVFLVLSSSVSVLNDFLMSAFGKDASFSGRNLAWSETLRMFFKSPIVGHGIQTAAQRALSLGSVEYVNAHNQLLEILYVGGLPLACVSSLLPHLVAKPPVNTHSGSAHRVIVCLVFIALGIEMLFEVIMATPAFWFLLLLAHWGCTLMNQGGEVHVRL